MSLKRPTKILTIALIVTCISTGFVLGLAVARFNDSNTGISNVTEQLSRTFLKTPSFDLITEGLDVVSQKYVDSALVDQKDLIYSAMEGLLKGLDDPYSTFLSPKKAKVFQENVNGSFSGIGAEIGMRDNLLIVISPLKNSPAERAGVKAGDKILKVDATDTKPLSLDEAVQIIRGPKNKEVVLTVQREGEKENIEISIIRDTIKIPSLFWENKEDGIAHISLYQFSQESLSDFTEAANEILKSNSNKIILDLRNNPGGFLEVAVDIAGWFLEPGKVVVSEERSGGVEGDMYKSNGPNAFLNFPVVVLINGGSASASEILAGALRDNRGVKIIGETSFGKGSVQELIKLSDGSSIKVTVAKWLTPSGLSIQDNGIKPDILVPMDQQIFGDMGDIQLEKAIEVIKTL